MTAYVIGWDPATCDDNTTLTLVRTAVGSTAPDLPPSILVPWAAEAIAAALAARSLLSAVICPPPPMRGRR